MKCFVIPARVTSIVFVLSTSLFCSSRLLRADLNDKDNLRARPNAEVIARGRAALDDAADTLMRMPDPVSRVVLLSRFIPLLASSDAEKAGEMLSVEMTELLDANRKEPPYSTKFSSPIQNVINLAAAYDKHLARVLIHQVGEQADRGGGKLPSESSLYIGAAGAMLPSDPVQAASLAQSSLQGGITPAQLAFLENLRQKDAVSANNIFRAMLHNVIAAGGTNVNELFMLFYYVFSPSDIPSFQEGHLATMHVPGIVPSKVSVSAELAREFLNDTLQLIGSAGRYDAGPASGSSLLTSDLAFLGVSEPQIERYSPDLATIASAERQNIQARLGNEGANPPDDEVSRWNDLQKLQEPGSGQATVERQGDISPSALIASNAGDRKLFERALLEAKASRCQVALDLVDNMSPSLRQRAKQIILFISAERSAEGKAMDMARQLAEQEDDTLLREYLLTLLGSNYFRTPAKHDAGRTLLGQVEQGRTELKADDEQSAVAAGLSIALAQSGDSSEAFGYLKEAVRFSNNSHIKSNRPLARTITIDDFTFAYPVYSGQLGWEQAVKMLAKISFSRTLAYISDINDQQKRLSAIALACSAVLPTHPIK